MEDTPSMLRAAPPCPRHAELGLSVIVPLAPGETVWRGLVEQLATLPRDSEVILVQADTQTLSAPANWPQHLHFRTCTAAAGRAQQQNAGARVARGQVLWFLHADSRIQNQTLGALTCFLAAEADALGYFDLRFADDGPRFAALNAWGANLRSRWFGLPFGDQGLLLPRRRFVEMGGFDETLTCGEDHRLVWAARRIGLPVVPTGGPILTSARKYARHGWLRTTLHHWRLTLIQAWPAWRRLRVPPR